MTIYVGVKLEGGPAHGDHVSLTTSEKDYYIWKVSEDQSDNPDSPVSMDKGKYKYDGHTANPRRFWWQGWEKDGYLP